MITEPNQYSREIAQTQAIIADVRCILAELKFELVLQRLRRKANFNPYQPRVPAGNPDGGQWTIVGGRITDRRVISDATPDDAWKPGTRYAQNVPRVRDRPVRLGSAIGGFNPNRGKLPVW